MDIVLLIVTDESLRQLYHQLLQSKEVELIPVEKIEQAIVLLSFRHVDIVIFYCDDHEQVEVEAFLAVRRRHTGWRRHRLILLCSEEGIYDRLLSTDDQIISPLTHTPTELADEIEKII